MTVRKIVNRLDKAFPDAHCELFHKTPYQLLVSVVLSAQTTDKKVNECMTPLYRAGFTPQIAVKMGQKKILQHIKSIGLAPTKSKNVIKLSEIVIAQHGEQVPNSREELENLPGVGRKTANVILGEIFGEPTLAVDTHVFRVTRRLGLHDESTPEKSERVLLDKIPPRHLPKVHHQFIFLGRRVCKARNPDCQNCQLQDVCRYYKENHS